MAKINTERKLVGATIEFTLEPADIFEEVFESESEDWAVKIRDGLITVTLKGPRIDSAEQLQKIVSDTVEAVLRTRALFTHRRFKLGNPVIKQEMDDGSINQMVFVTAASVSLSAGRADFIVQDANGNVIRDTRAERIHNETDRLNLILQSAQTSVILPSMLDSCYKSIDDPANELVYLFEIRDALSEKFGSDKVAKTQLGISTKLWSDFGRVCNHEPLSQGRHRGQTIGHQRPATDEELKKARDFAVMLISEYAQFVTLDKRITRGA